MPDELLCELCGKPLRGGPLEHLEEDRADCPAYDDDGKLIPEYAAKYEKTAQAIRERNE